MKIANTTEDFFSYLKRDTDKIRELHRAGFSYIDLSMYAFTPDCVYMQPGWEKEVYALGELAQSLGMRFVQAHSMGGNPLSADPAHREFLLQATLRSIEICAMLGIPSTVVHAGFRPGLEKERWFEENRLFYQKLFGAMEKTGVNVLCENSTRANVNEMYFVNNGPDMRAFIDYVDHPLFHGCWDTGHANCEGGQYADILALGKHLYAIHYNDNHGSKDEHLAPFLGTLNHDEVLTALKDVGYQGYFTLECGSSLVSYDQWTGKRRRFEKEGAGACLREPQLFMQRHLEKLLYDTACWMLDSYGMLEK